MFIILLQLIVPIRIVFINISILFINFFPELDIFFFSFFICEIIGRTSSMFSSPNPVNGLLIMNIPIESFSVESKIVFHDKHPFSISTSQIWRQIL